MSGRLWPRHAPLFCNRRSVPRPLRRGHSQAHVFDHRAGRRRILPAARSDDSGIARLSRLAFGREARRLLLSRAGVSSPQRRAGRIPASRHESFGRATRPADAEMLSLGLEATASYGLASPDIRTATSRCLRRWSPASICRRPGSGASSRISTAKPIWRRTSIA